jgi:dimethylaniline monooxygenase (N-oxide forming)
VAPVPFTCFEASDRIGGNWVFGNRNGMSAAYRQLHINTSRDRMRYSDFAMPKSYPDYPHHTPIAAYFERYVDHFGARVVHGHADPGPRQPRQRYVAERTSLAARRGCG